MSQVILTTPHHFICKFLNKLSWITRFSVYGAFVMGPTMFLWMRFASIMFPTRQFKHSLAKALTEQVTYDPAAICTFLFCMTLLEGKSVAAARHEVPHFLLF